MKKSIVALLALIIFVPVCFCAVKEAKTHKGTGEAKAVKATKKLKNKFTTDKNQVKQAKVLQNVEQNLEIKRGGKNIPPQSKQDVHPSTQY